MYNNNHNNTIIIIMIIHQELLSRTVFTRTGTRQETTLTEPLIALKAFPRSTGWNQLATMRIAAGAWGAWATIRAKSSDLYYDI